MNIRVIGDKDKSSISAQTKNVVERLRRLIRVVGDMASDESPVPGNWGNFVWIQRNGTKQQATALGIDHL